MRPGFLKPAFIEANGATLPSPRLEFASRDTLFTALVAAVRRYGRHTPGQWEDMKPGRYGYGDILKMTLALGRLLTRISTEGEHVGILMPNIVASVALLIGASAFGRIPCLLNYSAGVEGMQSACETARIRTIVTSRQFLAKANLEGAAASLRNVNLLYIEDLRARFGLGDKLWLLGFALWFPLRAVPRGAPESAAVVLFTSGSEGKPKGVVLSHRALLANVAQVWQVLPLSPGEKLLSVLPIFHSFGLTAGVLFPLFTGLRVMLYTSPLHYKVIPELIRTRQCTALFGTGTFLQHYARNAEPEDFRSLRYVLAGAEKLAGPIRQLWSDKFGIDILEGYGTTEMAPVIAVNPPAANHPGTVGRLLPGIEGKLVAVAGISDAGELHVRGPNAMSGYYRHDAPGVLEPPVSVLGRGWYNTGDVVRIDADGYLTIVGRRKRFAKVGGEMVSLEVVEDIARAASADAMHAATCESDLHRGESIILFTTDSGLTREQLAAAAHGLGFPEIALPRRIRVIDSLPLLGSGKVDYVRLQSSVPQS